jgi:hypothetical protein
LGIENRKLKIEKKFSLSKPATTTKKNIYIYIYFLFLFFIFIFVFFASARTAEGREGEGREGEGREGEGREDASTRTHPSVRTDASQKINLKIKIIFYLFIYFFCIRADASASARTHGRVRADAPCFIRGNFKKDATVRPSHGHPRRHRPIVRPSVRPSA